MKTNKLDKLFRGLEDYAKKQPDLKLTDIDWAVVEKNLTDLIKVEVAKAKIARDLTWKRRLSDAYAWAGEQCELESLTATGVWKVQEYIEQTELAEVESDE